MLDSRHISRICEKVYKQFPEVAGSQPEVRPQNEQQSLLIFKGSAQTADGRSLKRTVRVVARHDGQIVKMTTSR